MEFNQSSGCRPGEHFEAAAEWNSLGFADSGAGRIVLTEACVRHLQIDPSDLQLESHAERYPHLGEVRTWVGDLSSRLDSHPWQPAGPVLYEATAFFPSAPARVWNALAPGRSETCVTDRLATVHQVLDWQPFDILVVEIEVSEAALSYQLLLEPSGDGTFAAIRWYPDPRDSQGPPRKESSSLLARVTHEILSDADQRLGQPALRALDQLQT